jgi:hypothetical protein
VVSKPSVNLAGVTTAEVVGEICHRLMLKEAMDLGLMGRPASALKGKHDAIRALRYSST